MYKIEISGKDFTTHVDEKGSFFNAIQWAEAIALAEEERQGGPLKSIDIFEEEKLVASLRIMR